MSVTQSDSQASGITGKYRVLLELGQGGTANVYLAVAQGPGGFNKLVVLKALKSNLSSDPDFRRMFLNEARLSARLNHPNIVQVNEVVEQDGLPVIVMQYLEGQPMSNVVLRAGDEMSLSMRLRIINEVLGGLHYSHELTDYDGTPLNVVHRDMTPHNVFVTFDGQVKVLDFGIAKLSGSMVETETGVIKGKLRYMPPEQIAGDEIDRRADLFAVGIMLWEAATGSKMWKDMNEAAIMNCVLKGEIPSPRTVNPDCDPELERITMKALAHDRDERYATAADLQTDLEALLENVKPHVTSREVGKFVNKHFSDIRDETKRTIEEKLSKESSMSSTNSAKISFPPTQSLSRGGYSASASIDAARGASAGGRRWLWLAPAALILVAAGVLWKMSGDTEASAPVTAAPKPASSGSVSAAGEQGAQRIEFRVTAFPVAATIYMDDAPLPANPFAKTMPADGSEHVIRAEAEGYKPRSKKIAFDKDTDMVLVLEAEEKVDEQEEDEADEKASAPRRPRYRPRPKPKPKPKPKPEPKADCDPPYYVDDRGIKKFKPGCL